MTSNLESYIAKLRLSGISLEIIGMNIEDGYPELKSIKSLSHDPQSVTINLQALNNGKMIFTPDIMTFTINYNDIDYSIQTQSFIHDLFCRPSLAYKAPIYNDISDEKYVEIENRIKSFMTVENIGTSLGKAIQFYSILDLFTYWMTFKSQKLTEIKSCKVVKSVLVDTNELLQVHNGFYSASDLISDNQKFSTNVKSVLEIINDSLSLMLEATGCMYDVFTGEVTELGTGIIRPILTSKEKALLKKLVKQASKLNKINKE
jgi:hypothetical protein